MLTLRPAGADDEAFLLELRNEPETRRQSLGSEPIAADTHSAWFRQKLSQPGTSRIYVAETSMGPIGQARVDRIHDAEGEISLALAPSSRGLGLGRALIRAATSASISELELRTVHATVKCSNDASLRAFAAAGYEPYSVEEQHGTAVTLLRFVSDP
jgi:RimJ/RimL family protein N-acetyltransferase